jgi:hypothetical protein
MTTHSHTFELPSRRPSLRLRFVAWRRDRSRRIMAESLERAVDFAGRPRGLSAAVPVRAEALTARDDLLALAARLRTTPDPPPRAMELAARLTFDGTSPLFNPEASGTLRGAINEALLAFDADHETYPPEA